LPPRKDVLNFEGTTYYVCRRVNHFGHILVNMLVSYFHALSRIGLELGKNDMKF